MKKYCAAVVAAALMSMGFGVADAAAQLSTTKEFSARGGTFGSRGVTQMAPNIIRYGGLFKAEKLWQGTRYLQVNADGNKAQAVMG